MVPILAKQALARKCEFSNARMTGNYECAYALGVVSGRWQFLRRKMLLILWN